MAQIAGVAHTVHGTDGDFLDDAEHGAVTDCEQRQGKEAVLTVEDRVLPAISSPVVDDPAEYVIGVIVRPADYQLIVDPGQRHSGWRRRLPVQPR